MLLFFLILRTVYTHCRTLGKRIKSIRYKCHPNSFSLKVSTVILSPSSLFKLICSVLIFLIIDVTNVHGRKFKNRSPSQADRKFIMTGKHKGGAEPPFPTRGPSLPQLMALGHRRLQLTNVLGEPSGASCRRRPSMPAQWDWGMATRPLMLESGGSGPV